VAKEVLIDAKCVIDNGHENCSKTIPGSRIRRVVSGAEELLPEVPTVERSAVADNTEELARPFSSGGSIIVGARELDDLVSEALLVRKVPYGRADFDPRIYGDRSSQVSSLNIHCIMDTGRKPPPSSGTTETINIAERYLWHRMSGARIFQTL
jgi:hypothetical protein